MAEQVGKFLTELPELETPTDGDLMYIVDAEASANSASKKITMSNLKRVLGGNVTGTVEGASVSFSDGADGIPMEECEVTLVPSQDLHGYSKPWAGGAGKNKLEVTATSQYIYTVASDGEITADGTSNGYGLILGYITPDTTTEYKLNGCPTGGGDSTYRLDARLTSSPSSPIAGSQDTGNGATFTASEEFYIFLRSPNGAVLNNVVFKPMVRLSSVVDDTFEPYSNICPISGHTDVTVTVASTSGGSGEDTTVALGRTVYGGTLDVTTGELTVDKGYKLYTGDASENWSFSTDFVYINISDALRPQSSIGIQSNIIVTATGRDAYTGFINQYGNLIIYVPSSITSASDWKTWLSSNNLQIVYALAMPQTFTLTKEQIQTLLGQNYVSHDGGGNIKVVYIRDLDITINDLIDRVTALENE